MASNPLGRELKIIASSFVKQYYTLLNKAPCFIHNFYNQDSTFIHGTIELGTDHHNEPVVGRERIEKKMKELKLNDCRAKIKQIDCLETLAGGLVIQVIGELSNNGRPMRRFLQTFVLAPSPDQTRQESDQHGQMRTTNDNRRGVQISENSGYTSHQKFYVLNSIFRYQDDGPDSEFEDDNVSVQANASSDSTNGPINDITNDNQGVKAKPSVPVQHHQQQQQQIHQAVPQNQPQTAPPTVPKIAPKQSTAPESGNVEPRRGDDSVQSGKRAGGGTGHGNSGPYNGATVAEKKAEVEKVSSDNGKPTAGDNPPNAKNPPTSDCVALTATATREAAASTVATQSPAPAPKPSNEPKTWANMVRNTIPPSSMLQPGNATSTKDLQPSPTQTSSIQAHQPNSQQNPQNQTQNEIQQNNNNSNNRRQRHMIRKPSNKPGSGGRTMKNRNPRPQVAPAASAGKPTA